MSTSLNNTSDRIRTYSQKKFILFAIGGLFVGVTAMMVTNPGKSAYVNYASELLPKKLQQECSKLEDDINVSDMLTLPTQDLCKSFVGSVDLVGRGAVKLIVNGATERQNFGLFSIYTTQLPGRTFKTVGIGRHFVMFYNE